MDYQSTWDESFQLALEDDAANSVPPEALVREVSYFLRSRYTPLEYYNLRALDAGCGVGSMTRWFAKRGIFVDGIDISDVALAQANFLNKRFLSSEEKNRVMLLHRSLTDIGSGLDNAYNIVVEANTIQHLSKEDRHLAFNEIYRVLKPGGLFVAQQQGWGSSACHIGRDEGIEVEGDPLTYRFPAKDESTGYHLTDFQTHFFTEEEYDKILPPFSVKDVHSLEYYLPREEAERRGYEWYKNVFFLLYCIK